MQLDRLARFWGNAKPTVMSRACTKSKIENQKSKIRNLVPALLEWFKKNARDLPWRRTMDPYAIWVSEIMLQQTQVKTVLGYWERWMRALPTVKALSEANPAAIHKLWEGLGYYTRVRNMHAAAREIMAKHGGKFPREYGEILALPGIGRYTAGAVASIAFNEPRAILDGNVMRVLARVFGIGGNARQKPVNEKLWRLAGELVTEANYKEVKSLNRYRVKTGKTNRANCCSHLNQSLMELGALICTPSQPKCGSCPVRKYCDALRTGRISRLPDLGRRAAVTRRRFVAFVLVRRGRLLARQRPAGAVNAHLWEFPNVEVNGDGFDPKACLNTAEKRRVRARGLQDSARTSASRRPGPLTGRVFKQVLKKMARVELGFAPARLEKLCVIKHSITRYRITLEVYRGEMKQGAAKAARDGRWLGVGELGELAFTSAHRKILERIIM